MHVCVSYIYDKVSPYQSRSPRASAQKREKVQNRERTCRASERRARAANRSLVDRRAVVFFSL